MDQPEIESLSYEPPTSPSVPMAIPIKVLAETISPEQPKNCNCVESRHLEGAIACPDCAKIEQPNQNLMIFEQINGCCEMIVKLLNQLIPKTTHVEDCITTHNAWKDNNLKHLKGAFE